LKLRFFSLDGDRKLPPCLLLAGGAAMGIALRTGMPVGDGDLERAVEAAASSFAATAASGARGFSMWAIPLDACMVLPFSNG
jgi:hypothetical protein